MNPENNNPSDQTLNISINQDAVNEALRLHNARQQEIAKITSGPMRLILKIVKIGAWVLIVLGAILCITFIGLVIGVPMILAGIGMLFMLKMSKLYIRVPQVIEEQGK